MTINEAREILNPYEEIIKNIPLAGWDDYKNYYGDLRHVHSSSTRASIVHDHIIENAKKRFENVKGISYFVKNRVFVLNIESKILIRFKKLDKSIKSHNIKTKHTINYFGQVRVPGIPPAPRFIVGYQLNKLETSIEQVYVTYPYGDKNNWYYSLTSNQGELFGVPIKSDIAVYNEPDQVLIKELEEKRNTKESNEQ